MMLFLRLCRMSTEWWGQVFIENPLANTKEFHMNEASRSGRWRDSSTNLSLSNLRHHENRVMDPKFRTAI